MTKKEIKKLKQSIRTEMEVLSGFIALSRIGSIADANSSENREATADNRKYIAESLIKSKEKLHKYLSDFDKEIDEAIKEMS